MDIRNFFSKKKSSAPAVVGDVSGEVSSGSGTTGTTGTSIKGKSTPKKDAAIAAATGTRLKSPPKVTTAANSRRRASSSTLAKNPTGTQRSKRLRIADSDDEIDLQSPVRIRVPTPSDVSAADTGKRRKSAITSPFNKRAKEKVELTEYERGNDTPTSAADATPSKETSLSSSGMPRTLRSSPRADLQTTTSVSTNKAPPKPRAVKSVAKRVSIVQPIAGQENFDVDSAAPMCLSGTTFCFTGIMTDLPSRDDVIEMIKTFGGRVTGNVSGKTDFLVMGEVLEDGRTTESGSKYKRAVTEPNVILIHGASQLYGVLQQLSDKQGPRSSETDSTKSTSTKPPLSVPSSATTNGIGNTPENAMPSVNSYAKVAKNPYAKRAASTPAETNPYASKPQPSQSQMPAFSDDRKMPARTTKTTGSLNQLWVDKHKPMQSSEILGNQDAVRKLSAWLATWEDKFVSGGSSKAKSFSSPNGPWKAALLSGPPGIGKTTTATLVANEAGRDVIEFNASDVRSKKAIKEEMGDITGSCTLEFRKKTSTGQSISSRQKRCIIMDEVDGMGAGDRSGMAELIQMIKSTRVPIICICNDRQSQKMKSLLPYCMDLRYRRPVKTIIANRAVQIARLEGLTVEQNAAEAIVESCGNDVRQVLNCLQMWASNNKSDAMTYKSLKERERSINKDEILRVSLFDAARVIVEGRKGLSGADRNTERSHFFHRNDAYYVDYNFVGLLVQQNYLKILQPQFNDVKRQNDSNKLLDVLDRVHDAAQSMSDWAVLDGGLHGAMNWSLLPATAALAVKTGYHAGGESGGVLGGFPEFTTWLGRNSSRNKKVRLMSELNHHMNYKISAGTSEMRMVYLPLLRDVFLSLLTKDSPGNVEKAIEIMDGYGLDRDDIFEKLDEFNMDSKSNGFQKLDSKKKAAFTRLYNQGIHKSQALIAEQGVVKKLKRKASAVTELGDPDAIDDDNADEEDEEEEDDELDAEKIKALFKTRGRKTAASRKSGTEKSQATKAKPKARAPRKR